MKISVFGTGYVGLVTGVCFAEMGNEVICADIDQKKIDMLREAQSPIYEPGLDELMTRNMRAGRLEFTTDLTSAVHASEILVIAVGTPTSAKGEADTVAVMSVAKTIADHAQSTKIVITKSTVPIGLNFKIKQMISDRLIARGLPADFEFVSNPEFLREGCAIEDCLKPNRVVIGVESEKAAKAMRRLYETFVENTRLIIEMDIRSAEMTKYAANAMLATKISLMNEFSRLCEKLGADVEAVRQGIATDHRIGPHFIQAGLGYGGSCFPKDIQALVHMGIAADTPMEILKAVETVNFEQRKRFCDRISRKLGGFKGKTLALWGIAFKPGTDDIRDAPSLTLIQQVLSEGGTIQAFDPAAAENAKEHFNHHANLKCFEDQYDALKNAEVLVVVTEWKSFREPNFERVKSSLKNPLIFDGRNIYSKAEMQEQGIEYCSVGR
jgi:UDPglucose 6-dehydrogenase